MMWKILIVAFGLVLVVEGIFPFLSPERYKTFLAKMQELPDASIRKIGSVSMIIGLFVVVIMQIYFHI